MNRRSTKQNGTELARWPISGQAADSLFHTLLTHPLYRGVTIAMFITGLGASAAAPQVATYLTHELGASLGTAGLFYLSSLTGPVAGFLVGRRSDRTGQHMRLFRMCALAGFAGWMIFALANQLWIPFVSSALVVAFAGGAGPQLFAAIHDELEVHPSPHGETIVSIARMALTAGWVIGPVLGTVLAEWIGLRAMFAYTALCELAQLIPLIGVTVSRPAHIESQEDALAKESVSFRQMAPLLFFTAMFLCVYAGEAVRYAYLPIYMRDEMDLSASTRGMVIGVQPLVELGVMPLAVILARRIGHIRTLALGAACAVAAYFCFVTTNTELGLYAGQILLGFVWGIFFGIGIVVAQRLFPGAVATASAVFMNSTPIAMAFGGVLGGAGAERFGMPEVFYLPMTMAFIAVIGLLVMSRRTVVPPAEVAEPA